MKSIFRILLAPVLMILNLIIWVCSAILYCSSFVFGICGTLVGIFGIIVILTGSIMNGLILLTLAYLISPMGIPMAAAWILGKMKSLQIAVKSIVY